jgi:hypothetical protein
MAIGPWMLGVFGGDPSSAVTLGASGRQALYKTSLSQQDKDEARIRKDPAVIRDLARLDKAIAKAKTPEDLFKDPEAVRVLLQSLGLADQAGNPGLAKRALMSDPGKTGSLVNQLSDSRWKGAATTLQLAAKGLGNLRDPSVRAVLADGLVEYKRLSAIGGKSQAVADALSLHAMDAGATPNVYTVLGSAALRRVVTTVAGLPKELAIQSVEAQARAVQARFRLEDLADPAKREKIIQRYLAMTAEDGAPGVSLSL